MAADNTTNQRNPFDSDDDPFLGSRPDPLDLSPGPDVPDFDPRPPNLPQVTGRSNPPLSVLVCLDCETYYPDGDDWEFCPNCSAKVFEVSKD